jgi:hypothetical protein
MSITVYVDDEDRLTTVHRVNALMDRDGGTVVVHVPLPRFRRRLPEDLLLALGCDGSASDWPKGPRAAWTMARAWCHGFRIRRIVAYGAWRLHPADVQRLTEIADSDGIAIDLITLRGLENESKAPLGPFPSQPIERLFQRPHRAQKAYSERFSKLPPLPAAPFPRFLAECAALLDDTPSAWHLYEVYRRAFSVTQSRISLDRPLDSVVDHLVDEFRSAKTPNDVLIRWRATQAAALGKGFLVDADLVDVSRAVAGLLDTAASNHRHWPLPGRVRPLGQAAAALAWATSLGEELLCGVYTTDVLPRGWVLVAGERHRLPAWLQPPVRAQLWLKSQLGHGPTPLLSMTDIVPARGRIRSELESIGDAASNAPYAGLRMTASLRDVLTVWDVTNDARTQETRTWQPTYDGGRLGQSESYAHLADRWRRQAGQLAQLHAQRYLRGPAQSHQAYLQPTEPSTNDDARNLYAVLLRTGGVVDRTSVHVATGWTVKRLAEAVAALNALLNPLGVTASELPEGVLELRVDENPTVRGMVQAIADRDVASHGFSPAMAHLIYRLLSEPTGRIALVDLDREEDEQSLQRLDALRLIEFEDAFVSLNQETRSALAGGGQRAASEVFCL